MKTLSKFLLVFILLISFSSKAQYNYNMDSLRLVWDDTTKSDKSRLNAIWYISWNDIYNNPDTSIYYAFQHLDFANSSKDKYNISLAYNTISVAFMNKSDYDNSFFYNQKYTELCVELSDSNAILNAYNNFGHFLSEKGDWEKSLYYLEYSLNLGKKIKDTIQISRTFLRLGFVSKSKGNFIDAIDYYNKSLDFSKKIADSSNIARCLNEISNVYKFQGNYELAMEFCTKGLKIADKLNNNELISDLYDTKGDIIKYQFDNPLKSDKARKKYSEQDIEYSKTALKYYKKSLKLRLKMGNKNGIANSYSKIGRYFWGKREYDKAIENHQKSLKIKKEIGSLKGISACYSDIATAIWYKKNYKGALDYYQKSLDIAIQLGDKYIEGTCYNDMGIIHQNSGNVDRNYKISLQYLLKAHDIFIEINSLARQEETTRMLAKVYEKIGMHKKALEFNKLYHNVNSKLSKIDGIAKENQRLIHEKYLLDKQADSILHADEILIQQAENLAKEEQLKSEKQRRTGLLIIVGLVLVSLGIVFVQLRKTRAQKVVIEGQHQKLNQSHQEITDSINYAKRIQDALMTSTVYMKDVIPESFIFFQPKDVVSGDFYWVYRSPKGQIYFTVADCTGHGVPGAFMSMIGTSLLNEFIIENNLEDTAEILTNMRKQIIKSLKQEGADADNKDGMDMALCKYDPKKKTVQYSGAYNPLIHISKNEINHIKGDNQPIGLHTGRKLPFTNHEIKVKKGDMLYIYSDGFADQFGGERGKKYMSGKFKKFLLSISEMTTEEQEKLVKAEFTNWMGENEQIDDVCVMGVKVT